MNKKVGYMEYIRDLERKIEYQAERILKLQEKIETFEARMKRWIQSSFNYFFNET